MAGENLLYFSREKNRMFTVFRFLKCNYCALLLIFLSEKIEGGQVFPIISKFDFIRDSIYNEVDFFFVLSSIKIQLFCFISVLKVIKKAVFKRFPF